MVTKEQGVEVSSAGTGLKGEDSPAVLRQVEVLEHVKGLDNRRVWIWTKLVGCFKTCAGILGRLMCGGAVWPGQNPVVSTLTDMSTWEKGEVMVCDHFKCVLSGQHTPFKLVEVLFRCTLNSSFTVFDRVMSCIWVGEINRHQKGFSQAKSGEVLASSKSMGPWTSPPVWRWTGSRTQTSVCWKAKIENHVCDCFFHLIIIFSLSSEADFWLSNLLARCLL